MRNCAEFAGLARLAVSDTVLRHTHTSDVIAAACRRRWCVDRHHSVIRYSGIGGNDMVRDDTVIVIVLLSPMACVLKLVVSGKTNAGETQ